MNQTIKCDDCPIRFKAICSGVASDELEHLERIKSYKRYASGQSITLEGESMNFVGSVISGVATMSASLNDGRRQLVGLLLPSDFIGRPGRAVAPYEIVASTEVLLCRFQRPAFESLIHDAPALSQRVLDKTLDELDAAREWMVLLGRKTAREKIASLLLIISRRQGAPDAQGVLGFTLPLTREAMADYLGLTLETVSRQISSLKRDGIIAMMGSRKVRILTLERLIEETGDPQECSA